MITRIIKKISEGKVYFRRAGIYLSVLNFLMILSNFKSNYKINISSYYVIPIGFLFTLFVGWLDYIIIMKFEIKHNNKKNNIKTQLDRIENKINKREYYNNN